MRPAGRLSLLGLMLAIAWPAAASVPRIESSFIVLPDTSGVERIDGRTEIIREAPETLSRDNRRLVHEALSQAIDPGFLSALDATDTGPTTPDPEILAPWSPGSRFRLFPSRALLTERLPDRIHTTRWDLPDLYLVASDESRTKVLTGFKAAPFVDPTTGLAYFRARRYDPGTGTFLTPDPMGYRDSSNLYTYCSGDPINCSDPSATIAESVWDFASLGIGITSLSYNLAEEKYGAAALDVFGIALDTIALAVPVLPGGAGVAIKASRAAGWLGKAHLVDQTINVGQGVTQSYTAFQQGQYGWGTFYAGMSALGVRGMEVSRFRWQAVGAGSNLGNVRMVSRRPLNEGTPEIRDSIIAGSRARTAALRARYGHLSPDERRVLITTKKIGNAYRRYYQEAGRYWANRPLLVKPGQHYRTVLGQRIDARARARMRVWARKQGLGPEQGLFINRWLRDFGGSGKYRIPDVRYDPGMMIWDGTIAPKSYVDEQILDFSRYSRGHDVEIVTPW